MLESGFSKGCQRLEMPNSGKPADGRRCRWSRRHFAFIFLVLLAIFCFYGIDLNIIVPNWNPKLWVQNSSSAWWSGFNGENEVSQVGIDSNGSRSAAEPGDAAAGNLSAPTTAQSLVSAASVVPVPIPYVSPGPYVVEYPYEYHFVINEPQKCKQEKPFVVLMVPVAPLNRKHRDDIRSTWGSESSVSGQAVRLFFILGLQAGDEQLKDQLLQESKEHHDLLQADFLDCYKNLTIKTMVMLEWLDAHCSGASYAMKVDSDMFLNVPNLVSMLLKAPKTKYMTGLVAEGAQVLRDPWSKWYLPEQLYPQSHYPRYALGLGYVLSLDLPKKLIEASRHVKPVYIEDVYLGLCMQYLGIPPTSSPNWNDFNVHPAPYNRCAFSKIVVTATFSGIDRVWVWKDFKKKGPSC